MAAVELVDPELQIAHQRLAMGLALAIGADQRPDEIARVAEGALLDASTDVRLERLGERDVQRCRGHGFLVHTLQA